MLILWSRAYSLNMLHTGNVPFLVAEISRPTAEVNLISSVIKILQRSHLAHLCCSYSATHLVEQPLKGLGTPGDLNPNI